MLSRSHGNNAHVLARQCSSVDARVHLAVNAGVILVAAWALTTAATSAATPPERMPVTTLRPLLLAALAQGSAHGILVGEAVPFMTQHFGSAAPIEIDVRVLQPLPQRGCQRLEVTTTQRAVTDPKTARAQDARLVYQISYCRSGDFPAGSNP